MPEVEQNAVELLANPLVTGLGAVALNRLLYQSGFYQPKLADDGRRYGYSQYEVLFGQKLPEPLASWPIPWTKESGWTDLDVSEQEQHAYESWLKINNSLLLAMVMWGGSGIISTALNKIPSISLK